MFQMTSLSSRKHRQFVVVVITAKEKLITKITVLENVWSCFSVFPAPFHGVTQNEIVKCGRGGPNSISDMNSSNFSI
jgi:hypothetical protein